MQLSATSRPTRVRRLLAISAAAAFVMIGPTACDYGAYSGGGSSDGYAAGGQGGQSDGDNVVPVGNSSPSTDEQEADRDRWQNAYISNGGGQDDDGDDNEQPAATTEPAAGETTDPAATPDPAAPAGNPASEDPAAPGETVAPTESGAATDTAAPGAANGRAVVGAGGENRDNNGQDVLGRDCSQSNLDLHTGFQVADPTCVETAMGEIAAEDQLPSLLITGAPEQVGVGEGFELQVSTRNLVRDRFLGAAAGGYYLESSFLNGDGLQRGHFHTACRILSSTSEAPDSSGAPAFFVATQDNGGGAAPDTVTINVPGINTAGELQCTSWAGDGSHRTPMMSRANQTPAIDSVRITVGGNGQAGQAGQAGEAGQGNGNAAGGAAQSEVPQPGEQGAGQTAENTGAENNDAENDGAGNSAENQADNGADEGAEATGAAAETNEAEVNEVANNSTADADSTAGAGATN